MWTPKRIIMLAGGFLLFLSSYFGYSRSFLGAIDGLPALPEVYYPPESSEYVPPPPRKSRVEEKLKQAFGPACTELTRAIRLEIRSRHLVLAANDYQLDDNGRRIMLKPVSLAVFGKPKRPGGWPDINTLTGQVAYLTLDRPVSSYTELNGRKIIGAELRGGIELINNRKTEDPTDDLSVHIGAGPLFYDDLKHLVWTHDAVHLVDHQSKPKPNEIWGKGMELHLATEGPPTQSGRPDKVSRVSGVKKILLQSHVDMYFYVDSGANFLGSNPASRPKPPAPTDARREQAPRARNLGEHPPTPPGDRAHIHIKTPGKFQYDVFKDHDIARFDVPPADPGNPPSSPEAVQVVRHHPSRNAADRLLCQHLEMRITGKTGDQPRQTQTEDRGRELHIETVRATGPAVTLTSDLEKMSATGNEMIYDTRQRLTIIRGSPHMEAEKDNTLITAREMQIQEREVPIGSTGDPTYHETLAIGPGRIDLFDKKTNTRPYHATWNQKLIVTRDGPHDLLVLTGTSSFLDDINERQLRGEMIKVWLQPRDPARGRNPIAADLGPTQSRRPHHIEVLGNVETQSKELTIHNTSRLLVWFKDIPPDTLTTLGLRNLSPGDSPQGGVGNPQTEEGIFVDPIRTREPGQDPPEKKTTTPRPLYLTARTIEAWVQRGPDKDRLEKLWTEGSVHIQQAAEKEGGKGIDVQGETLLMKCSEEGNYVEVTGDLAQLRLDKIFILGPKVFIDQVTNKAWVPEAGAMQLDSTTTLSGEKLDKDMPLTIHWQKTMLFDGQSADFLGNVNADQENSRLACHHLQVFFDRAISLKEGSKGKDPPRIKHLVCHREVRLEDQVKKQGDVVKYQRLEAFTVSMNALEPEEVGTVLSARKKEAKEVRGSGPGRLRIYQKGDRELLKAPQGGPAEPNANAREELKLTYVEFSRNMYGNSRSQTVHFWGDVRVLNFPCDNPQMEIDLDKLLDNLPEGAMFLSAADLEVLDRGQPGHSQQEMKAKGRVTIRAKNFEGRGGIVTYNEAKEQIILDGGEDGQAILYKIIAKGAPAQEIKGKKITYLRRTGAYKIDDGRWIFGN